MLENKKELDLKLLMFVNHKSEEIKCSQILYKLAKEPDQGKFITKDKYFYCICDKSMLLNEILKGKDVYEFPEFNLIVNANSNSNNNKTKY